MRKDKLIQWARKNQSLIFHIECFAYFAFGLLFVLLGYLLGHAHIDLLQNGVRTQGRVVEYKAESFSTIIPVANNLFSYQTVSMPIIEFQNGGQQVRFRDWITDQSGSLNRDSVPVIYNPNNPSIALVDRPVINWLLWAPIFFAGLFLVLRTAKNWLMRRHIGRTH